MMGLLSDKEVMNDYVLSKIIRYNHRQKLQDESVATHSFYVALLSLKIMAKLEISKEDVKQTLVLAILHDVPESFTSDIPHDVKTNYPKMANVLDDIEVDFFKKNWKPYLCDVLDYRKVPYLIVKLADAYSVYQYCENERILGNVSDIIQEIRIESTNRIEKHTKELFKYVKEKERCES